jgi:signal transduction histidine kinase
LRLPGRTARLRLTLLYTGMFLVLGTALIAITYLLVSGRPTIEVSQAVPSSALVVPAVPAQPTPPVPPRASARSDRTVIAVPSPVRRGVQSAIRGEVVQQHSADLRGLLAVSWLVLAVSALASAVLGWLASGRVLRPLREMTATARTISAGNLGERLALTGPDDEFKALGDTLDALLGRLDASFEAQRRFVANASHELRTPLTLERTLLQVALADPDASAQTLRATCEELLASGREHERLLEALLTLASSERGLERREPIDLATCAGEVLATQRPLLDRHGLRLSSALDGAAISGDPTLVARLIANLLDNATRYNRAGGRVEIRTAAQGGLALLTVANTGAVVAAGELERLFEPFARLPRDRITTADGHHGLGLSIVRAIATAHGATVSARAQPGGGLEVTVAFPSRDGTAVQALASGVKE